MPMASGHRRVHFLNLILSINRVDKTAIYVSGFLKSNTCLQIPVLNNKHKTKTAN